MKFTDPKSGDEIEIPMIHLNGTGYEGLKELYGTAISAVNIAEKALNDATPHGRDYYINGDFELARREHRRMQDQLIRVREHLSMILNGIHGQRLEKFNR